MSEHDHDTAVGLAPNSVLDPEPGHEGSEGEREPGHAPRKKAVRFPFAHRSSAGAAKWKRETRFGLAAMLSFVILVTVLLINKQRGKDKPDGKKAPHDRPVVLALSPSKDSPADSSKSAPKPDPQPDQGGDSPPLPARPNPELPPSAEPAHIPLPDDKVREAGNESVPQPAGEQGGKPPLPPPGGATPPDKTALDGPKEAEPDFPLPEPTALPPATNESSQEPVAPPKPAAVAESAPAPPGESVGQQAPPSPSPSPGATDLPGPAEPQGAAGSNEVATPPAQPSDLKTDLAFPGAEPGTTPGNTPAPPVEQPPPGPAVTESPAPMPTSPATPPQGGTEAQTPHQTPAPPQVETQTLLRTQDLPPADAPAQAQTPAPPQVEAQTPAPPQVEAQTPAQTPPPSPPPASPSPAVAPGEVPNFDRAPSTDDSMTSSSAPPEIKPGEGIPIPNAGKGRSLDDAPVKAASVAAAATGISSAARAVERDQIAPELHVVERGENFWTISKDYYSSGRYYMALWKANSRTVPAADKLMVGQTIIIPPFEALDRSQIDPPRVSTGTSSASSSSRTGAPVRRTSRSKPNADDSADTPVRRSSEVELILPIDNSVLDRRRRSSASEELDPPPERRYRASRTRYKVRAGETLRSIARDTLSNSRRSDDIYELNQDILGNDPYKPLVEGQILELPEDARLGRASR